jgi:hypothetical protein
MRTPQYYVRTASGCYVSGKTIPNGLTIHREDAHRFDRYIDAMIWANKYSGRVEPAEHAQEDVTGRRAPQTSLIEDNAAQAL